MHHDVAQIQEGGPVPRPRPILVRDGLGGQRGAQRVVLRQVGGVGLRDQPRQRGVLAEVLELELRVTRRVAPQHPLAMRRLVPELLHDDDVLFACHARAVAPPRRQLQQRGVARLGRDTVIQRRHAEIGERQRDGEVLEEKEKRAE